MATAGKIVLTTTAVDLFNANYGEADDGFACETFYVGADIYSSSNVEVNVAGLHKPDEWFPIARGSNNLFRLGPGSPHAERITRVRARATNEELAIVLFGVVARF
jgi:hypothetical protein